MRFASRAPRQQVWNVNRLLQLFTATIAAMGQRTARGNRREVPASLVDRISQARDRNLDRAMAFHEGQPLQTGVRGGSTKEGCLRFPTDPRTPFTNNEAECDLRTANLHRRIPGGFRAIMCTVIATARGRGWNMLGTPAHPEPTQLIPQLRLLKNCQRYRPGSQ